MAVEISIIKDGQEFFLNLPEEISAQFQQRSPVFEFNKVPGAYSFQIEFPAQGNELILGFQTSDFVSDAPVFIESRFYHNGAIKYKGSLLVERIRKLREGDEIESSFVVNGWAALIEGVSIREVCNEVITLGDDPAAMATQAKALTLLDYPSSKVFFSPFINDRHYSVEDGSYQGTEFNSYNQATQSFRFNTDGTSSYGLVPSVYMLEVLKQCFEFFGYNIQGDALEDPRYQKILIDGLTSLDDVGTQESALLTASSDFLYDPIGSGVPSPYETPPFDVVTQDFTSAGVNLSNERFYTMESYGSYTFDFTLVLGDINGTLDIRINHPEWEPFPLLGYTGSGNETISFSVSLEFTGFGLDVGAYIDIAGGFGDGTIKEGSTLRIFPNNPDFANSNRWLGEFRLGDCLPDTPIKDFIKDVRKLGVNIFFDDISQTAHFITNQGMLSQSAHPITELSEESEKEIQESRKLTINWDGDDVKTSGLRDLGSIDLLSELPPPVPGTLIHVYQTGNYYIPKLNETEDGWEWRLLGQKVIGVTSGEGREEKVSAKAKLPLMDVVTMDSEEVLTRSHSTEGASTWQEQGLKSYPLFFSIAHGMQSGSVGLYPHSSPYEYDYSGATSAAFSLLFEREGIGLFEIYWAGYVRKLYGSSRTSTKILLTESANELLRKKVFYQNVHYLIERLIPEFSRDNVVEAMIELRKIGF